MLVLSIYIPSARDASSLLEHILACRSIVSLDWLKITYSNERVGFKKLPNSTFTSLLKCHILVKSDGNITWQQNNIYAYTKHVQVD